MLEYTGVVPQQTSLCLNMSEYMTMCVNMSTSAGRDFVSHSPIVILCLLEHAITYFNVYTKLEFLD